VDKAVNNGLGSLSKDEAHEAIKEILDHQNKHEHGDIMPGEDFFENLTPSDLSRMARDAALSDYQIVRSAIKAVGEKSRGVVPGNIMELIEEMNRTRPVPWAQVLEGKMKRGALGGGGTSMVKFSRPKAALNRRSVQMGDARSFSVFPGYGPVPQPKVVMAIDTSGSMSDDELAKVYAEVKELTEKMNAVLTIIQFDTDIHEILEAKSVKDLVRSGFKGRGGTDFNKAFSAARLLDPDCFIVYTDGYAPMPAQNVRLPEEMVLWLLTPSGVDPNRAGDRHYGEVIHITEY
jgi:predicted metal-dependent peptidase